MYRLFSKQNLRSKEVHLQGVLWETTDFICESKDCGRVTNGYGNYVSKLKERVDELEKQDAAIRRAIRNYYLSLDLRAHGNVAKSIAFLAVEKALGLEWRLGEEAGKRLLDVVQLAQLPAVPPMLEGEWLITQPNGRQYVVHSSAKASIARKCGYTVEEIQRTAESAPGQSNQCIHTGNQA
jgi:hypothetical protein